MQLRDCADKEAAERESEKYLVHWGKEESRGSQGNATRLLAKQRQFGKGVEGPR